MTKFFSEFKKSYFWPIFPISEGKKLPKNLAVIAQTEGWKDGRAEGEKETQELGLVGFC